MCTVSADCTEDIGQTLNINANRHYHLLTSGSGGNSLFHPQWLPIRWGQAVLVAEWLQQQHIIRDWFHFDISAKANTLKGAQKNSSTAVLLMIIQRADKDNRTEWGMGEMLQKWVKETTGCLRENRATNGTNTRTGIIIKDRAERKYRFYPSVNASIHPSIHVVPMCTMW